MATWKSSGLPPFATYCFFPTAHFRTGLKLFIEDAIIGGGVTGRFRELPLVCRFQDGQRDFEL